LIDISKQPLVINRYEDNLNNQPMGHQSKIPPTHIAPLVEVGSKVLLIVNIDFRRVNIK
jgi:hypothetical protein